MDSNDNQAINYDDPYNGKICMLQNSELSLQNMPELNIINSAQTNELGSFLYSEKINSSIYVSGLNVTTAATK